MFRCVTIAIAFSALAAFPTQANDRDSRSAFDFQGRYIVSVSDADMVSSAYVNGKLGPKEGSDALSIIELGSDPRSMKAVEVNASNSVAGPPASVDITPDGRFAFVIETFTPRPEDDAQHTFRDLKTGNIIQVFDLTNPSKPKKTQELKIPARPDAVRVSKDGAIVAVSFNPGGGGSKTPIALIPFKAGKLGEPTFPAIADWDLSHRLIDIDWHPKERIIVLLNATAKVMRFANVTMDMKIKPFGNAVEIEREPFRAIFTPDGRHVIANALYWGTDIAGRWVEAPRGSIISVRMNAEVKGDTVRHAFVGRVNTGVSPEGLAVSPDGRWVASTNLERSYLPYDDKRITWFSSITLAALDPESGSLSKVGDFAYDGILPEAAVFDNSSRHLAVATYDHFDDRRAGGSIDFWRITEDPLAPHDTLLLKTEYSVPVTRGAHSMVIAR